jgi:ornithine cyclodeaminase
MPAIIGPEAESRLDWIALTDAIEAGHRLPQAQIRDILLYRGQDTLLSRSAWIDGMGLAVKSGTIFPRNADAGKPSVQGAVALFSDADGQLEAILDFILVTKWKTAGDSLLAARKLARPDSRRILLVGAGAVSASLVEAYGAAFPDARFSVWARRPEAARAFADRHGTDVASDLPNAVGQADIIATATMSSDPVLMGDWLRPGTHIDLIGAYTPAMREADSACFARASVFVDARATTIEHIGDLIDPIREGVITPADVRADFYDIACGTFARRREDEITLCKNGGGAHLDLMTSRYILAAAGA